MTRQLRKILRKVPGLRSVVIFIKRLLKPNKIYQWQRQPYTADATSAEMRTIKVLNVLDYTKTSGEAYAATKFPAGYHTLIFGEETLDGKRSPQERLAKVPYDFTDKTILDIGSNQGGMLFALGGVYRWAVGVDYDYRMVNASNVIKREFGVENIDFFVFDIDKDPHELLLDFMPEQKVDMVFLLAVCLWVNSWRELIDRCAGFSDAMLFESNGSPESQDEQVAYLKTKYDTVTFLSDQPDSNAEPGQRRFYFAENTKLEDGRE